MPSVETADTQSTYKELIKQKITNLRTEYQAGQEQMRTLEQRQRELQYTLLRISGAIQALDELLNAEPA